MKFIRRTTPFLIIALPLLVIAISRLPVLSTPPEGGGCGMMSMVNYGMMGFSFSLWVFDSWMYRKWSFKGIWVSQLIFIGFVWWVLA